MSSQYSNVKTYQGQSTTNRTIVPGTTYQTTSQTVSQNQPNYHREYSQGQGHVTEDGWTKTENTGEGVTKTTTFQSKTYTSNSGDNQGWTTTQGRTTGQLLTQGQTSRVEGYTSSSGQQRLVGQGQGQGQGQTTVTQTSTTYNTGYGQGQTIRSSSFGRTTRGESKILHD